jgi:flagellar protein FliJ
MKRGDPLETALRVRRLSIEEAKRVLSDAIANSDRLHLAIVAATDVIRRETDAASVATAEDSLVEAFAAWLPRGLAEQARLRDALTEAQHATSRARAALTVARTAEAAVKAILENRSAEAAAAGERRSQAALDEVALNIRLRGLRENRKRGT